MAPTASPSTRIFCKYGAASVRAVGLERAVNCFIPPLFPHNSSSSLASFHSATNCRAKEAPTNSSFKRNHCARDARTYLRASVSADHTGQIGQSRRQDEPSLAHCLPQEFRHHRGQYIIRQRLGAAQREVAATQRHHNNCAGLRLL